MVRDGPMVQAGIVLLPDSSRLAGSVLLFQEQASKPYSRAATARDAGVSHPLLRYHGGLCFGGMSRVSSVLDI